MLAGYSDYLAGKICQHFGTNSKFKFVQIQQAQSVNSNQVNPADSNTSPENFEKICEKLVKEFNGKVVS
jgi:hypothetical protein